mmetsp:Transcript_140743/g.448918  ORF Transcript_140743/g.448918 Transcript_140743/m.448918 type:complete len:223 (+) Transcript_140743:489-1157(+)
MSRPAQQLNIRIHQADNFFASHLDCDTQGGLRTPGRVALKLTGVYLRDTASSQKFSNFQSRNGSLGSPDVFRAHTAANSFVKLAHPVAQLIGQEIPSRGQPLRQLDENGAGGLQGCDQRFRPPFYSGRSPNQQQETTSEKQRPARPYQKSKQQDAGSQECAKRSAATDGSARSATPPLRLGTRHACNRWKVHGRSVLHSTRTQNLLVWLGHLWGNCRKNLKT